MGAESATSVPTIETDLPCVHCGYNLRMLGMEGRCPECNHTVAESVASAKIGPVDFQKLAQGAGCLAACVATIIVVALGDRAAVEWFLVPEVWAFHALEVVAALLMPVLMLAGVILLVGSQRYHFLRVRAARTIVAEAILLAAVLVINIGSETIESWLRDWGATYATIKWVDGVTMAAMTALIAALLYWGVDLVVRASPPRHRVWVAVSAVVSCLPLFILTGIVALENVWPLLGWGWWELGWRLESWCSVTVQINPSLQMDIPVWDRVPFVIFWLAVSVVAWRHRQRA